MVADLFSSGAEHALAMSGPLAERLRPTTLDEVVGQDELVGAMGTLRRLLDSGVRVSVILWGPPGSGKTSLARLIASEVSSQFEQLSAVSASVRDIRQIAGEAERRLGERSVRTTLFLDEIHRFTRSQQDALLPHTETGLLQLIGATTESPWATMNAALLSRCTVLPLKPMDEAAAVELIARAQLVTGSVMEEDASDTLVALSSGDARRLLTVFEAAAALSGERRIDSSAIREVAGDITGAYGRGEHYDSASALIKHMRAGDAEQAMAWMRHMVDGGEDPMFVARRLVIFASEDIGEADRGSLLVASAALEAVRSIGMPEAIYPLGHAILTLSHAPKSRGVVDALSDAAETIRHAPSGSP